MAEFGWTVPCLVAEEGELIAGHGRVLAPTQPLADRRAGNVPGQGCHQRNFSATF